CAHAGAADPAGRDHRIAGGDSRCTELDAARILRPGSDSLGDDPPSRASARNARHPDGNDPGPVTRRRRGSPIAAGGGRGLRAVRAARTAGCVHGHPDPDLQLDVPAAGRVPGTCRRGQHRAARAAARNERGCDSAAQPLREESLMQETTGTAPGTTDIPATRPGGGPERRHGPVIVPPGDMELEARNLSVLYGETRALTHIPDSFPAPRVVAVTWPSTRPGGGPERRHRPVIVPPGDIELEARNLSVLYGETRALKHISISIPDRRVVAFIGPSGCGKSTLLRCFNRMNDLIPGTRVEGEALFHGENLYGPGVDPVDVRRRIGMVFQKPNPFPKSIYDNVAYGPRINGFRGNMDDLVERSLRQAALWDEVKDRLD